MSLKEDDKGTKVIDLEGVDLYSTPNNPSRKIEFGSIRTATSDSIKNMESNEFYTHSVRILSELIPNDVESIKKCVLDIYLEHQIFNPMGLSLLHLTELPSGPSSHPLWTTSSFRKGFKLLMAVSKILDFDETTTFDEIRAEYDKNRSILPLSSSKEKNADDNSINTVSESPKFSIKAIQQIELNEFSGESEKYTEWYDSTVLHFGRAAAKPLLEDESLCDEHIDISFAAKCIVASSLENGSASHMNTQHKNEKNLARFMRIIAAKYDNAVDARNREFTQWKNLFLLQMDKPEESESFINSFKICVSKLKEHHSKAVEDEALMSALILHAVRAKE